MSAYIFSNARIFACRNLAKYIISSHGNSRLLTGRRCSSLKGRSCPSFPFSLLPPSKPFSTHQVLAASLTTKDDHLDLLSNDASLSLPYLWLRDHCRCNTCYEPSTKQKNILTQDLDLDIRPKKVKICDQEKSLHITWPDGHETNYSLQWLHTNAYPGPQDEKVAKLLWDKEILTEEGNIPRVDFEELVQSDDTLKVLLRSLLRTGVALVDGVPVNVEGTKTAAERISYIQRTLYGDMWTASADAARDDTAYTNIALGAHTDNTYFHSPTGIQVFHCEYHDGSGGETLLVDGFKVAEKLRFSHPEAFHTLSTCRIEHENIDYSGGVHLRCLETIFKLHPVTGALQLIRFNPYDRAPLNTVHPRDQKKVYSALAELGKVIAKPENEFWIKLRPGMALFVDNWRVMHGRASFTGNRKLNGCYLPRDDWVGKARVLGLVWD